MLLGVCDAVVSQYVNELYRETGRLLPTRGNVHDLSGAITHKRKIITLYLEGYLTPEIAQKTDHAKESVDRYIHDCHRVETLWRNGITDLDTMSQLSHLAQRVVLQYIISNPTNSGACTSLEPKPLTLTMNLIHYHTTPSSPNQALFRSSSSKDNPDDARVEDGLLTSLSSTSASPQIPGHLSKKAVLLTLLWSPELI